MLACDTPPSCIPKLLQLACGNLVRKLEGLNRSASCHITGHLEQSERDILNLRSQQGRFEERVAMMQGLLKVEQCIEVPLIRTCQCWCLLLCPLCRHKPLTCSRNDESHNRNHGTAEVKCSCTSTNLLMLLFVPPGTGAGDSYPESTAVRVSAACGGTGRQQRSWSHILGSRECCSR